MNNLLKGTGLEEIEELGKNELREGSVIVLYTTPGVFTTYILNKFTEYIISAGRPCVYFSSDTAPWLFVEKHERAGGKFRKLLKDKKVVVLDLYNSSYGRYSIAKYLGEASRSVFSVENSHNPIHVLSEYRRVSCGRCGGVFESVPTFASFVGEAHCMNFFRKLIISNKMANDLFIYKIQRGILSRRFEAFMESISDLVIELKREGMKNLMMLLKGNCQYRSVSAEYRIVNGRAIMKEVPPWAFWMEDK